MISPTKLPKRTDAWYDMSNCQVAYCWWYVIGSVWRLLLTKNWEWIRLETLQWGGNLTNNANNGKLWNNWLRRTKPLKLSKEKTLKLPRSLLFVDTWHPLPQTSFSRLDLDDSSMYSQTNPSINFHFPGWFSHQSEKSKMSVDVSPCSCTAGFPTLPSCYRYPPLSNFLCCPMLIPLLSMLQCSLGQQMHWTEGFTLNEERVWIQLLQYFDEQTVNPLGWDLSRRKVTQNSDFDWKSMKSKSATFPTHRGATTKSDK